MDPGVSAAVHYVSSLYYKAKKDFAEFYKSSLLYLAFVSSEKLEHDYKLVCTDLWGTTWLAGRCFLCFTLGAGLWRGLVLSRCCPAWITAAWH